MSHGRTKERLKKRLTRLTSPFTGPQSPPMTPEQKPVGDAPAIHVRSESDSSLDLIPKRSTSDISVLSSDPAQGYYPGAGHSVPFVSISRPSTRSSASYSSVELNLSPSGGANALTGSRGSGSGASTGPSPRYLSTNGKDHAFLLSHGKTPSTPQLQMPIPVQTQSHASHNSYTSTASSSSVARHQKANSANGIVQPVLPSFGPVHTNGSLSSLPISMVNPLGSDTHLVVSKSSSRIQPSANTSVYSGIRSAKASSSGGGLLRQRNGGSGNLSTSILRENSANAHPQIISHHHTSHLPLRCPYIKEDFVLLQDCFQKGVELRIGQMAKENELILDDIRRVSDHLDTLCTQVQTQIDELEKFIVELEAKSAALNEDNNACMLEDMNDLIKRIDLVTLNVNQKKESIHEINKHIDILQELKKNGKVATHKRRKWYIFAGGVFAFLFVLKLAYF